MTSKSNRLSPLPHSKIDSAEKANVASTQPECNIKTAQAKNSNQDRRSHPKTIRRKLSSISMCIRSASSLKSSLKKACIPRTSPLNFTKVDSSNSPSKVIFFTGTMMQQIKSKTKVRYKPRQGCLPQSTSS